jgi:hypothetical protein
MKPFIRFLLLTLLTVGLPSANFSVEEGRRVDDFLTRIAQRRSGALLLRKDTFSASELNAYFNLFYNKKFAPELTYLNLDLKDDNLLSGTAKVELKGKRYNAVPAFLRNVEVRFSGRIESGNRRMRFLINELVVNGAHLSPAIIDEAYSAAQGGAKVKKSIFDWFTLLPGVKGVSCSQGRATFLY